MSWLVPPRRFDPALPEMMDRPGNDPALLRDDLRVLERINRHLGGHAIVRRYLRRWRGRPALTVLDLATGGGDIPRLVARWGRRRGVRVKITAVDANPEILAIAREWSGDFPEIQYQQADLLKLGFADAGFDLVLNSLTLHHFAAADVARILQTIERLARLGYLVNDLRRRRAALTLSRWMARTIIANPIARFDAPASCERAFTVAELRALARQAGLRNWRVERRVGYRMTLTGQP